MRRSGAETLVLRGLRADWALWAARAGRVCFCVLGGLFFWWLLGSTTAQAEPMSVNSLVDSTVNTVVDELTNLPSTGVPPVDRVTSTVGKVVRGVERSSPRSEPLPPRISTPPAVAAPPPAPTHSVRPDRVVIHAAPVPAPAPAAVGMSTKDDAAPGVPPAPPPPGPYAEASALAQALDAQPSAVPVPAGSEWFRLPPRDEDLSDLRVTRPDVFPD